MKTCENCGTAHIGEYGSGRFCSSKCARGFSTKYNREETSQKTRLTFLNKERKNPKTIELTCKVCGYSFVRSWNKRKTTLCSNLCIVNWNKKNDLFSRMGRTGGLKSAISQNRRSKNEIYFSELCSSRFKSVKLNESMFNGWDADIIIEDLKIAILWNGKWHYEKLTKKHSIEQVKNRDSLKIKEIIKCGYTPYVIQDMGKKNKKFVEEQFNKFNEYINCEL